MLLCFVFAKLHPRRSPRFSNLLTYQRLNVPTRLSSKSLPHNLFADPHPLNPVTSIPYKNLGGQGVPATLPSFFSISHLPYTFPSSVSRNSFVCHSSENTGGVGA